MKHPYLCPFTACCIWRITYFEFTPQDGRYQRKAIFLVYFLKMPIVFTKEQQDQLDREAGRPPAVQDPRSNRSYVLVPEDQYQQMLQAIDDDSEQRGLRRAAARNLAKRLENEKL